MRFVRLFEMLPKPEGDGFEVRLQQREVALRKRRKQLIVVHGALLARRREHTWSLCHRRLKAEPWPAN